MQSNDNGNDIPIAQLSLAALRSQVLQVKCMLARWRSYELRQGSDFSPLNIIIDLLEFGVFIGTAAIKVK